MISPTPTEMLPFETDAHGVVRVGHTRVTLDTIVMAFTEGATAEEIAQQYPSLQLADIYSVIGYYLRHRSEVDGDDRGPTGAGAPGWHVQPARDAGRGRARGAGGGDLARRTPVACGDADYFSSD